MILLRLLLAGVWMVTVSGVAQSSSAQIYTLLSGSQLIDDCPICDRIPTVVPMTGTFGLRISSQNPLFTSYELVDVSFHAGTNSGLKYQVVGTGSYQVGGEVAILQQLFLDIQINNGSATTSALCASTNGPVAQPWPTIQIQADQTNGTPGQVYHLTLVAVPAPRISSLLPDIQTGDVRLDWEGTGGKYQLERAPRIDGPYSPVTPITTNSSFTDVGALTNSTQFFYRLHPF